MRVGIKNRVDALNGGSEGLQAKIGRGVDQYPVLVQFDKHAGAKAFVAWVGGGARLAMATDHRNAHAGARSEYHDRCPLEILEHLCGFGPFPTVRRDDERWLIAGLRSARLGARGFLQLVDNLDITETEFGEPVLQQSLLLDGEVALCFFVQHAQEVQ